MTRSSRRVIWIVLAALLVLLSLAYFLVPIVWDRLIAGNSLFRFYGRVVDNSGKPIAAVVVRYDVSAHTVFSSQPLNPFVSAPTSHSLGKVTTDSNGNFDIRCDGIAITIDSFTKPGYTPDGPDGNNNLAEPDLQFYYASPGQSAVFTPAGRVSYVLQLRTW